MEHIAGKNSNKNNGLYETKRGEKKYVAKCKWTCGCQFAGDVLLAIVTCRPTIHETITTLYAFLRQHVKRQGHEANISITKFSIKKNK